MENSTAKILWDLQIQTDKQVISMEAAETGSDTVDASIPTTRDTEKLCSHHTPPNH